MNILGKDIFLCVSNGSVKTSNLNCDILGLRLQCYSCLKKDSFFSGFHYISIEAITICTTPKPQNPIAWIDRRI